MNSRPVVFGIDEQDSVEVDVARWVDLATQVLADRAVVGPAELNLTFVGRDQISELNEEHMGSAGPTDVLSFPLDDDPAGVFEDQVRMLGDVVICAEVVVEQATGSLDDEFALMVVHGVLHILGMDHAEPDETAEMTAAERQHIASWRTRSSVDAETDR